MILPLEIEQKTEEIRQEIGKLGAELVEIAYRRSNARSVLTIVVDKSGGITMEECVIINKHLGLLFDASEILSGAYLLEVQSPGLDRPIRTENDFLKVVGESIRVIHKESDGRTWVNVGELVSVQDSHIEIRKAKSLETLKLPIEQIVKAVREIRIKGKG